MDMVEREMWDAVILDGPTDAELDLLEIRLNELAQVVDKVFIVESNRACPLLIVTYMLRLRVRHAFT